MLMSGGDGSPDFAAVFEFIDRLPGWLTRDQARVLFDAASAIASGGTVLEIGSHHGRSAIVLASALPQGARLVAVDPFPDDWRYGAAGTEVSFRHNIERAGVTGSVLLRVASSREVRRDWSGPADLVYIDGKHDYWTVRDDLRWAQHVPAGGWIFVHDAFSSFGVTTGLLRELLVTGSLRFVDRTGSLARLQVGYPSAADRARVLAQLPWWLHNLVIKVCLRLRLRPIARLLGHDDRADPY